MSRISGVELEDNWKIDFALTRIRGIGWPLSVRILNKVKVDKAKRVSTLSSEELAKIAGELENYDTEGELSRRVKGNIQRLTATQTYRGIRHQKGLPVRGQRTRTNARTKRGKRKTVGAFKKEMRSQMKGTQTPEEKK